MQLFMLGEKAFKATVWKIFQEIMMLFFPSMKSHIVSAGSVMCVEINFKMSGKAWTKCTKTNKLIQDHFLMSWVTTNC